jgi:hypothetical protein
MERAAIRGELSKFTGSRITLTVGDLLRRYRDEIIPNKRSREMETYMVNAMLRQAFCNEITNEGIQAGRSGVFGNVTRGK